MFIIFVMSIGQRKNLSHRQDQNQSPSRSYCLRGHGFSMCVPLGIITQLRNYSISHSILFNTYQNSFFTAMTQSASSAMATCENFAVHAQEHRVKLTHHNLVINGKKETYMASFPIALSIIHSCTCTCTTLFF